VTNVTRFNRRMEAVLDELYGTVENVFARLQAFCQKQGWRSIDLFHAVDASRGGVVLLDELLAYIRQHLPEVNEVQLGRLYKRLDGARLGRASYKEMGAYLGELPAAPAFHVPRATAALKALVELYGDSLQQKLCRWGVNLNGWVDPTQLRRMLRADIAGLSVHELAAAEMELLAVTRQEMDYMAVYDVLMVLKVVWTIEIQVPMAERHAAEAAAKLAAEEEAREVAEVERAQAEAKVRHLMMTKLQGPDWDPY
jgi:hypothetical protein